MIDEKIKTELLAASEKLAESAMTGAVDRAILITIGPAGWNYATVGIGALEVIGALQIVLGRAIAKVALG